MTPTSWPRLRLSCGHCGRLLVQPTLTHGPGERVWEDQRSWAPQGTGRWWALAAGVVVHMKRLPGVGGQVTAFRRDVDEPRMQMVTTWALRCRCGRDYRLRSDRLAERWAEVKRAGESLDLALGRDM